MSFEVTVIPSFAAWMSFSASWTSSVDRLGLDRLRTASFPAAGNFDFCAVMFAFASLISSVNIAFLTCVAGDKRDIVRAELGRASTTASGEDRDKEHRE